VRVPSRRAFSVKGLIYQRLAEHCEATGQSVSGFVEKVVAEKLDAAGVPVPDKVTTRPKPRKKRTSEDEPIPPQHLVF
jgi:hypothetical protein